MIRTRFPLLLAALICMEVCAAQDDFSWWNRIHGWDGVTPWNRYMTLSAKYFGPNALPVPEVRDASVDSVLRMDLLAGGQFSRGDRTLDGFLRIAVPLAAGKAAFEVGFVPLEYYVTDTVTRDERASRERDGKGFASGDLHFASVIRLLKGHERLPDVALEAAFRTASGKPLLAARYTDAPGYHMDLSFGREFMPYGRLRIRAYAMTGYYCYQTFDPQHLQDDCFLYGVGVRLGAGDWSWSNQFAGYTGYMDNGDRPLVYRSELRRNGTIADAVIRTQIGLRDFGYRSLHVGVTWKIRTQKRSTQHAKAPAVDAIRGIKKVPS